MGHGSHRWSDGSRHSSHAGRLCLWLWQHGCSRHRRLHQTTRKRRNSIGRIEHAESTAGITRRRPSLDGFRGHEDGVAAAVGALGLDDTGRFRLRAVGAKVVQGELLCG